VLGTADMFIDNLGLPTWLFWLAFSLLVMGLPVVMAISLAKEEVYGDDVPAEDADAAALEDRRLRFLTWRTAGFAFVGAVAMWGVVLTGWVVLGGTGYLLFRGAAAGFVEAEDCVVVAEFENETEDAALGLAMRTLVVTDIEQTSYVNVLGDERLLWTLELMRLPDTTHVDQRVALEIARRENCPAVVAGTVAPLGTGYVLNTRILEAATGEEVVPLRETASNDSAVIPATERLAQLVRRHLGESLPSIRRSEPLPRITTGSLEALRLYTLARRRFEGGDRPAAIRLLEDAVELDTAFAVAYFRLSGHHLNLGDEDAARHYSDLAYRFRDRLTRKERYHILAQHHARRFRVDSAVIYRRLLIELDPNDATPRRYLCQNLNIMGRFEEALETCRGALEIDPRIWTGHRYLGYAARALGQHTLADSALAVMRELTGRPLIYFETDNAIYRGDFEAVDSLARELLKDRDPALVRRGYLRRAWLAAMYGRMDDAFALAQTAGLDTNLLWFVELGSLAADAPERALPYVDSLRRQSPPSLALFEYERLGVMAYGYALAGDIRPAQEILAAMDSVFESNDFHAIRGIRERVLALIALQESRPEEALEQLRRAQLEYFGYLAWDIRFFMADAYTALGQLDQAIAQYDAVTNTYRMHGIDYCVYFALRPVVHERLGTLYLEVGDTVSAARHLTEFIELWQDADPELQPRVESARRLLAQLAAEGTG
jgi:tetratricopeptide (TPR) repeat protein